MAEREPVFRINPKHVVLWAIVGMILIVGAVAGIGQLADYHKMLRALENAHKGWFALGLGGEIAAYVGYVVAYRDVARAFGGPRFDYWTSTRVVIMGFGAFVAGSSFGTLGVDYWALSRAGEKPHQAVRRVLALNTLEWGILAVLAKGARCLFEFGTCTGRTAYLWPRNSRSDARIITLTLASDERSTYRQDATDDAGGEGSKSAKKSCGT